MRGCGGAWRQCGRARSGGALRCTPGMAVHRPVLSPPPLMLLLQTDCDVQHGRTLGVHGGPAAGCVPSFVRLGGDWECPPPDLMWWRGSSFYCFNICSTCRMH